MSEYEYPNQGPLYGGPDYPGHGYPPRRGDDRPAGSAWGRLCRGGALGKKASLVYDADATVPHLSLPILQLNGDDADAQQVVVTLSTPGVVAQPFTSLLRFNAQNLSGSQDNAQVTTGNFPGDGAPISWPPIEAVIEWGVGGHSSKAVVDFVNGATVGLTASWLRVSAVVTNDPGVSGTRGVYEIAAFVGPGYARGGAQRTKYMDSVNAGAESARFPVPSFAKRAYVVGRVEGATPPVTAATLRLWQSPSGTGNVGNFVFSGADHRPCDVPAGSAYASVVNQMGVTAKFCIVYDLAI